jgi:hypothetical protein
LAGELIHYGARPWAIAIDIDSDGDLAECIRRHFPVVEFVSFEQAANLHQREFDAAVVVGHPPDIDASLQVLQFGGTPAADRGALMHANGSTHVRLLAGPGVGARTFVLGDAATPLGVAGLTKQTVVPEPGSEYPVLRWSYSQGHRSSDTPDDRFVTEFAADAAGDSLAGYVKRSSSPTAGYLWWLPDTATVQADRWLIAAIRWWQQIDAGAFPPTATWTEQREWMTHGEILAADAIDRLDEEADEFHRRHEVRLKEATAAQEAAQATAASGPRRLLLAQGDELVEAVIETLNLLGFSVVDSDRLTENAQFKQEDLRIIDGAWTCLAEVKGYKKGAKASDLLQVGKAVEVYMERGNPRPAARWYVVNHNLQTPPNLRDAPLAGAPEVPVFASMGGTVLDTRVLFAMHRSVEAGDLSPEDARAKLKQAAGVHPVNG